MSRQAGGQAREELVTEKRIEAFERLASKQAREPARERCRRSSDEQAK